MKIKPSQPKEERGKYTGEGIIMKYINGMPYWNDMPKHEYLKVYYLSQLVELLKKVSYE